MKEEEKTKKSDDKKTKEKAKATTSSSNARSKYRGNQPGMHKKVRKIVHSNTVEEAKKFIAANTTVLGLNKDLDQAIAKKERRIARRKARENDPIVQKRLLKNKIQLVNTKIHDFTNRINARAALEAQLRTIVINPNDTMDEQEACAEMKKDLEQRLESGMGLPELHEIRNGLKHQKTRLEEKL